MSLKISTVLDAIAAGDLDDGDERLVAEALRARRVAEVERAVEIFTSPESVSAEHVTYMVMAEAILAHCGPLDLGQLTDRMVEYYTSANIRFDSVWQAKLAEYIYNRDASAAVESTASVK